MQPRCPERRLHPLGALFGIELGARLAREHLDRNPEAAPAPLGYVLQLAEAGLAQMRAQDLRVASGGAGAGRGGLAAGKAGCGLASEARPRPSIDARASIGAGRESRD